MLSSSKRHSHLDIALKQLPDLRRWLILASVGALVIFFYTLVFAGAREAQAQTKPLDSAPVGEAAASVTEPVKEAAAPVSEPASQTPLQEAAPVVGTVEKQPEPAASSEPTVSSPTVTDSPSAPTLTEPVATAPAPAGQALKETAEPIEQASPPLLQPVDGS